MLAEFRSERGGHFMALEAPDFLIDDIRAFFRPLHQGERQIGLG